MVELIGWDTDVARGFELKLFLYLVSCSLAPLVASGVYQEVTAVPFGAGESRNAKPTPPRASLRGIHFHMSLGRLMWKCGGVRLDTWLDARRYFFRILNSNLNKFKILLVATAV